MKERRESQDSADIATTPDRQAPSASEVPISRAVQMRRDAGISGRSLLDALGLGRGRRGQQPQETKEAPPPVDPALADGLGSELLVDQFIAASRACAAQWGELSPAERMASYTTAANQQLEILGIPTLNGEFGETGTAAARFSGRVWTMVFSEALFASEAIAEDHAADIAMTAYHEARHAEQYWLITRLLIASNRTPERIAPWVPVEIASQADALPVDHPQFSQADAWTRSFLGEGREERKITLQELRAATAAYDEALAAFEAAQADPSSTPAAVAAARQARDAAYERYEAANTAYHALPEEADAWEVGRRVKRGYGAGEVDGAHHHDHDHDHEHGEGQQTGDVEAGATLGAEAAPSSAATIELSREMRREVQDYFPNLNEDNWSCLVWKDNGAFNCFAHSVGLNDKVIGDLDVNPMGSPAISHWDAFYASHGYGVARAGADPQADVLLYGKGEDASHAACKSAHTLVAGPAFESKLGAKQLIVHTLEGLENGRYGDVIRCYFKS